MRRRRLWLTGGLLVTACCAIYVVCGTIESDRSRILAQEQFRIYYIGSWIAKDALIVEDPPLALPRGDIGDLWRWVRSRPPGFRDMWRFVGWRPEADTVCDSWGRPIVYRFPASRHERIFDFYSVGPNGVDEMGGGDDVAGGSEVEFEGYSHLFRRGIVDVDWVRAHLDELERDGEGKIIGAPPDKIGGIEHP